MAEIFFLDAVLASVYFDPKLVRVYFDAGPIPVYYGRRARGFVLKFGHRGWDELVGLWMIYT